MQTGSQAGPEAGLGQATPSEKTWCPPLETPGPPAAELPSPLAGGCGHGTGLCGCPGVVGTRWSGQRACGEKQAIGRHTRPVHVVLGGFFISGTVGGAGCTRPSSQRSAIAGLVVVAGGGAAVIYSQMSLPPSPSPSLPPSLSAAALHRCSLQICDAPVLIRRVRHAAMHTPSAADVDPFFPPQAPCNTTTSR